MKSSPNLPLRTPLFSFKERQKQNEPENRRALTILTDVFLKHAITKDVFMPPFLPRQGTLCVAAQSPVAMDTKDSAHLFLMKKKKKCDSIKLFIEHLWTIYRTTTKSTVPHESVLTGPT